MKAIFLNDVTKSYRVGRQRNIIVHNLTLAVEAGEVFGFLGPNGAGKSTVIKLLLNFIRPDHGRLFIQGRNVRDELFQSKVGYLPETPYFYEHLTGEEMLYFAGSASGITKKRIQLKIKQMLERLRLRHAAKQKIRTYSKGMKQRLGLACTIIHDPDVLILDEPMSGLDPLGRKLVADVMQDVHSKGKTIFFSSHILSDVENLCNRISILNKGKLLFCDTIEALKSTNEMRNDSIESAFVSIIEQDNRQNIETN